MRSRYEVEDRKNVYKSRDKRLLRRGGSVENLVWRRRDHLDIFGNERPPFDIFDEFLLLAFGHAKIIDVQKVALRCEGFLRHDVLLFLIDTSVRWSIFESNRAGVCGEHASANCRRRRRDAMRYSGFAGAAHGRRAQSALLKAAILSM